MPNEMPLTTQMSALITYANGITGATDTKLGDAVHTLADGYGGGGGGGDIVTFDLNLSSDVYGMYTIPLTYGRTPKRIEIKSNSGDVYVDGVVPSNTTVISMYYSTELGFKAFRSLSTTLTPSNNSAALTSTSTGYVYSVSSTAIITAHSGSRRLDKRLTYTVTIEF